jgi:hypothetical protein
MVAIVLLPILLSHLTHSGCYSYFYDPDDRTYNKKAETLAPFAGCNSCTVEADMQFEVTSGSVSLLTWYQNKKNYVEVLLNEKKDKVELIQKVNGSKLIKMKTNFELDPHTNYRIRISQSSNAFNLFINGSLLLSSPAGGNPSGTVGFRIKKTTASFEEIIVF